jgi:hypothetical protein
MAGSLRGLELAALRLRARPAPRVKRLRCRRRPQSVPAFGRSAVGRMRRGAVRRSLTLTVLPSMVNPVPRRRRPRTSPVQRSVEKTSRPSPDGHHLPPASAEGRQRECRSPLQASPAIAGRRASRATPPPASRKHGLSDREHSAAANPWIGSNPICERFATPTPSRISHRPAEPAANLVDCAGVDTYSRRQPCAVRDGCQ